jgi:hypothetical protein
VYDSRVVVVESLRSEGAVIAFPHDCKIWAAAIRCATASVGVSIQSLRRHRGVALSARKGCELPWFLLTQQPTIHSNGEEPIANGVVLACAIESSTFWTADDVSLEFIFCLHFVATAAER